jgi:WD40 repeat protein
MIEVSSIPMTDSPEPPKRRLPRFSLRSLLLFVALCGCGAGLWASWDPWRRYAELSELRGEVVSLPSFSWDGKWVVGGDSQGTVYVWDVETGRRIRTLRGHTKAVKGVFFSKDGNRIISYAKDNTVMVWDGAASEPRYIFKGHATEIVDCQFTPNEKALVVLEIGGGIRVWNLRTGLIGVSLNAGAVMSSIGDIAPDSTKAVFNVPTKNPKNPNGWTQAVIDLKTGRTVATVADPSLHPYIAQFDKTGQRVLSSCYHADGLIVWDAANGSILLRLSEAEIFSCAIAQFVENDTRIFLWGGLNSFLLDAKTGKLVRKIGFDEGLAYMSQWVASMHRGVAHEVPTKDRRWEWFEGTIHIAKRIRPEGWQGRVRLPEFWLTFALTIALLGSLRRDWKGLRATPQSETQ